jgi:hypothetical protein
LISGFAVTAVWQEAHKLVVAIYQKLLSGIIKKSKNILNS